jgi:hypothetical protein
VCQQNVLFLYRSPLSLSSTASCAIVTTRPVMVPNFHVVEGDDFHLRRSAFSHKADVLVLEHCFHFDQFLSRHGLQEWLCQGTPAAGDGEEFKS